MMKNTKIYNIGYINGYLDTFSRINSQTNHNCNAELCVEEKNNRLLSDVLDKMFSDIDDVQLTLTPIDNIEQFLIKNLKYWFFEFQSGFSHSRCIKEEQTIEFSSMFEKIGFTLADEKEQEEFLMEFTSLLLETIKPTKAFTLTVTTQAYYACDSLDIIFENETEVYNLWFTVDD